MNKLTKGFNLSKCSEHFKLYRKLCHVLKTDKNIYAIMCEKDVNYNDTSKMPVNCNMNIRSYIKPNSSR